MKFPKINAFPTYWANGMKLSATHFQHLEDSVEEAVRDTRSLALLSGGSFGLLPYSNFSLRNAQGSSPQSVKVILENCQAILPGGYRIEILNDNIQKMALPDKAPFVEFIPTVGVRYHLFLTIPEKRGRIPAGLPQTRPIRLPHLVHDCQLECVPHEELPKIRSIAANRMKVAEWQDKKIIEGYIPANLTISGFDLLNRWHHHFQNQLENMVRISLKIIKDHRVKDVPRADFCLPIVQQIRSSKGYFNWVLPNQSPIFLAAFYGDLAGLVKGIIETSHRDFVRNQLQNGDIHQLNASIDKLLNFKMVPYEEMAIVINRMDKFGTALLSTLQSLMTFAPPKPRTGERGEHYISSG